jgi:hypothetical protein
MIWYLLGAAFLVYFFISYIYSIYGTGGLVLAASLLLIMALFDAD